jgi:hypothetical protein
MSEVAQEKDILESINEVFADLTKDKDKLREIDEYLAQKHKMTFGTFDQVMNDNEKLNFLTQEELICIIHAMHVIAKDERIAPTLFFSEKEIQKGLKLKLKQEDRFEFPYVIEGVLRASHNEFLTLITYQELKKIWNAGLLTYNYETQRAPKKKLMAKGNIKKTPTVIKKSVNNIARLMLEGKFLKSTLTFNILADGNDNYEYEDGDLIIEEGTNLNIVDGMHRLMGTMAALEENPDLEGSFEVSIRNYDLNMARYHIGLLNTVNRFDKNLVRFNTDDSFGGLVTKNLIQIPELRDRVETDKTTVSKTLNMITNYSILADSINITFKPESTKEMYEISDFLKKFYGYFLSAYPEDFKTDMKKRRSVSWFNHHNMHCGFMILAKLIYDKYNGSLEFPVSLITQGIETIDYTKGTGNKLDKIMLEQGNRNSNQSKELIRKYFQEELRSMFE